MGTRGFYSPPSHHGFDELFATTSAVPTWDPGVTPTGMEELGARRKASRGRAGFPMCTTAAEVTENLAGDDSRVIMDRVIPFIEKNQDGPLLCDGLVPHPPRAGGCR